MVADVEGTAQERLKMKVKVYSGTFVKSSGEDRTMNFVRFEDLPNEFLDSKIKNRFARRQYREGVELVWDIVNKDFRTFNWNAVKGNVAGPQDMEITQ